MNSSLSLKDWFGYLNKFIDDGTFILFLRARLAIKNPIRSVKGILTKPTTGREEG
jgi:hypothetical protein